MESGLINHWQIVNASVKVSMKMIKPFKSKKECDEAIRQSECNDVLRRGNILHLGMFHPGDPDDPDAVKYPYVVPLAYGYDCKDDKPVIYMHLGYRPQNTRIEAIKKNPHVFFAVETGVRVVPIPFSPCMSTVRYLGVEGRGVIDLLCHSTEKEEVEYAMEVIMRQMTGKMSDGKFLKWDFNPELLKFLVILKLTITAYKNTSHAYDFKPADPPWSPPYECRKDKDKE